MADEPRAFRQKEDTQAGRPQTIERTIAAGGKSEMTEIEVVLRAAEPHPPAQLSLESWTRMNENVMDQIGKSSLRKPTFQERRQRIYDRLTASDSRLKDRAWIAVAAVVMAVIAAFTFWFFIRQH